MQKKSRKRAITPTRMVGFFFQIFRVGRSWCADHFYPARILIPMTVFELLANHCYLPLYSYVLFLVTAVMLFIGSITGTCSPLSILWINTKWGSFIANMSYIIPEKFQLNWFSEFFEIVNGRRLTHSDGISSPGRKDTIYHPSTTFPWGLRAVKFTWPKNWSISTNISRICTKF